MVGTAVSYTWDGNDARYDDPMHWTPNGVPGDEDAALISSGMLDLSGLTIGATSITLSAAGSSSSQGASGVAPVSPATSQRWCWTARRSAPR